MLGKIVQLCQNRTLVEEIFVKKTMCTQYNQYFNISHNIFNRVYMTFKTLSKRQNGTIDPSLCSLQKYMRWLTGKSLLVLVKISNWKQEIWFFAKSCHLTKGSKPFCIYWLQQSYASVCIIETSCSSWCARSALLVLRIVPSSWNNDVGIGQMIHFARDFLEL
jgi:hypothetical protein